MVHPQEHAESSWSDSLIELLERQHMLVDELAALADHQAGFIREARTDALLGLLGQRQRIIERFTRAQDELSQMTDDVEARLQTIDEERRGRIRELIGSVSDRLAAVMERDAEDQRSLETARNDARGELSSLDAARHARTAYLKPAATGTRFSDRRG